jgi:glutamate synthase (NADPH/NADH) small chain
LRQQNKRNAGDTIADDVAITATDKHVVVIGGGDTGSDCIGTSIRQGAASVVQLEILPQPPEKENKALTWPLWPNKLRTTSSHDEGIKKRYFSVNTQSVTGTDGKITHLNAVEVEWKQEGGQWKMSEKPDSAFTLKADIVFLAMGFVHPVHEGLLKELGVELERNNIKATDKQYQTSVDKVFAAGDGRRGQSLVVWAIREGRQAARAVDEFLMGSSELPR